ncbi:MAG: rod shape-determining protein [Holdemanella sp.]|nr:rod shape-determining protein [Holdemanella sp.]
MFEKWYALDPGSYELRLYDYQNDEIVTYRSCIAYKGYEIVGLAKDALEYVYHQNKSTQVKYPMDKGYIKSDVFPLLNKCLKDVSAPKTFYKACLRIYLTEDTPAIRKKWLSQIQDTIVKRVDFVSEKDLLKSDAIRFCIHAGHSYTRIMLMMNGKSLFDQKIDFAGQQIDEMIQSVVTRKTQCLISSEDAKNLKEAASRTLKQNKNARLSCFAMNRYQQYQKIEVSAMDIWPCMEQTHQQILLWTKYCFDKMTLEMKEKVMVEGIYLTGGLADCFGLRQYLEYELKCPVHCDEKPALVMIEKMKGMR